MDLLTFLLMTNKPRIDYIKESILRAYRIDREVVQSIPFKNLFIRWNRYIAMPKESLKEHTELKKALILVLGAKVEEWLVLNTTFLHQTHYLNKRYGVDRVVENTIDLINYRKP